MKMWKSKRFFALLVSVLLLCTGAMPAFASNKEASELQFQDGKFKILILADIQDTDTPQKETTDLIEAALDKTAPNLVVLLGDNIAGYWRGVDKEKTARAVDAVASLIDARGIPFALVFGNHDHEGLCHESNGMQEEEAKAFLLSCFQKYDTCLAIEGEEMTGVGNYNLPILDSNGEKAVFNLWFMDSNPYATEEEGGGYGYVHEDQTAWYQKTATALQADNGGVPLPSLLFQHIIVPEVYNMLTEVPASTQGAVRGNSIFTDKHYVPNPDYIYEGTLGEGPCPPNVNHGQFASWVQQGDVIGAFFGHDHVNDFAGIYEGIHLVAAPGTTYYSYGDHHGVRTITLEENNLTTFQSDVLLFEELVGYKVKNLYKANHGYSEYRNVFLPILGGVSGALVLLAVGTTLLVKHIRKKKEGQNE